MLRVIIQNLNNKIRLIELNYHTNKQVFATVIKNSNEQTFKV